MQIFAEARKNLSRLRKELQRTSRTKKGTLNRFADSERDFTELLIRLELKRSSQAQKRALKIFAESKRALTIVTDSEMGLKDLRRLRKEL